MSFERLTTDTNVIRDLADRPNDVNGLSADQLKAKFDQIGEAITNYINNTLLNALEDGSAAGNIGIEEITGLAAGTVQEALLALKAAVDSAVTGDIPDDSLETGKYKDRSVTGPKIALNALEAAHHRDRSITGIKIALGAITAELLAYSSVTEPKLAQGAVSTRTLANGSVTVDKLASGAVRLRFADVSIPVSSWAANTEYTGYGYRAAIPLSSSNDSFSLFRPNVIFSPEDAESGILAPFAVSYTTGVYVYAKEIPDHAVIASVIELWR